MTNEKLFVMIIDKGDDYTEGYSSYKKDLTIDEAIDFIITKLRISSKKELLETINCLKFTGQLDTFETSFDKDYLIIINYPFEKSEEFEFAFFKKGNSKFKY